MSTLPLWSMRRWTRFLSTSTASASPWLISAAATFQKLSADGFRVLGVAIRKVEQQAAYALADEKEMTLAGFAAFLDPPKEGILAVLDALKKNGVSVVIMTGDNQHV